MNLTPKQDEFGLWGLIDEYGYWVIQPFYDEIEPFRGEYARAVLEGKKIYVDKSGFWFDDIPQKDKEEFEGQTLSSSLSPLDILTDGFSRMSDALHKGLRDSK